MDSTAVREINATRTENRGGYNLIFTDDDKAIIFDLRGRANEVTPTSCTCGSQHCPHKAIAFPQATPEPTNVQAQLEALLVQATTLADVTARLAKITHALVELEDTLEDQSTGPEVIFDFAGDDETVVMPTHEELNPLSDESLIDRRVQVLNPLRIVDVRRQIAERRHRRPERLTLAQVAAKVKLPVQQLGGGLFLRRL